MSSLPEFAPTGHVLVRAPSQLLGAAVDDFIRDVEDALPWCPWVLVDLSDVVQLDGSGLAALDAARRLAVDWGGDLSVFGLDEDIVRTVELIVLRQLFPMYAALRDVPALPPRAGVPQQRRGAPRPASEVTPPA